MNRRAPRPAVFFLAMRQESLTDRPTSQRNLHAWIILDASTQDSRLLSTPRRTRQELQVVDEVHDAIADQVRAAEAEPRRLARHAAAAIRHDAVVQPGITSPAPRSTARSSRCRKSPTRIVPRPSATGANTLLSAGDSRRHGQPSRPCPEAGVTKRHGPDHSARDDAVVGLVRDPRHPVAAPPGPAGADEGAGRGKHAPISSGLYENDVFTSMPSPSPTELQEAPSQRARLETGTPSIMAPAVSWWSRLFGPNGVFTSGLDKKPPSPCSAVSTS